MKVELLGKTLVQGFLALAETHTPIYRIKITAPPGFWRGEGELRIIREKEFAQGKEWVLTYSRYFREPS